MPASPFIVGVDCESIFLSPSAQAPLGSSFPVTSSSSSSKLVRSASSTAAAPDLPQQRRSPLPSTPSFAPLVLPLEDEAQQDRRPAFPSESSSSTSTSGSWHRQQNPRRTSIDRSTYPEVERRGGDSRSQYKQSSRQADHVPSTSTSDQLDRDLSPDGFEAIFEAPNSSRAGIHRLPSWLRRYSDNWQNETLRYDALSSSPLPWCSSPPSFISNDEALFDSDSSDGVDNKKTARISSEQSNYKQYCPAETAQPDYASLSPPSNGDRPQRQQPSSMSSALPTAASQVSDGTNNKTSTGLDSTLAVDPASAASAIHTDTGTFVPQSTKKSGLCSCPGGVHSNTGGDACTYDLRDHQEPANVSKEYPNYENGKDTDQDPFDVKLEDGVSSYLREQVEAEPGPICFPGGSASPTSPALTDLETPSATLSAAPSSPRKPRSRDMSSSTDVKPGQASTATAGTTPAASNYFDSTNGGTQASATANGNGTTTSNGSMSVPNSPARPLPRAGQPSFLKDMGDGVIRTPGPGQMVSPKDAFMDFQAILQSSNAAAPLHPGSKPPSTGSTGAGSSLSADQAAQSLMAAFSQAQRQQQPQPQPQVNTSTLASATAGQSTQPAPGVTGSPEQKPTIQQQLAQQTNAQGGRPQVAYPFPGGPYTQPAPKPAAVAAAPSTNTSGDIAVPSTATPAAAGSATQTAGLPPLPANYQSQPAPLQFPDNNFFSHQAILASLAAEDNARAAAAALALGQQSQNQQNPFAAFGSANTNPYLAQFPSASSSTDVSVAQHFGQQAGAGSSDLVAGGKKGKGNRGNNGLARSNSGSKRGPSSVRSTYGAAPGTTANEGSDGDNDTDHTPYLNPLNLDMDAMKAFDRLAAANAAGIPLSQSSRSARTAAAAGKKKRADLAGGGNGEGGIEVPGQEGDGLNDSSFSTDEDDEWVAEESDDSFGKPAKKKARKSGASAGAVSNKTAGGTPYSQSASSILNNLSNLPGMPTPDRSLGGDDRLAPSPASTSGGGGKSQSKPAMPGTGNIPCEYTNPRTGEQCPVKFRRPYDLARHMETVHGAGGAKPKWSCATCKKTFSRKDALIRHGRISSHATT